MKINKNIGKNCCKNHHAYSMIGVKKGAKYEKKKKIKTKQTGLWW